MPRRSKRIKTATQPGGRFGNLPRSIVVHVLKFFDIHEVARLQRLVCHEFRDAGQERIKERGGRKLYEVGMAFFYGLDHENIDEDRGQLLLRASCEAGYKIALVQNRMFAPDLSDEDKPKILKDLKKISTSSPYHWVYFLIGEWYRRGFGGENKNQAVAWFEKAIHKGNTEAMYALGSFYGNGLGLTQSDAKANELWALAADKGHALARCSLGNSYRLGRGGLAIDFNRCVKLWDQGATQGFAQAQTNLGQMYHLGSQDGPPMTIPVNPQLSFRWFLAAAKQEHVIAMGKIGDYYYFGSGVEQNDESALEWYKKAAIKGHPPAQFNVGHLYEKGRGCEIDLVQAMHWYQKSAAQGNQQAIDAVERLS